MLDAIIIGGGISGLTTGYLLQQKGMDIAVVEKNSFPGGPGCLHPSLSAFI